MMKHENILHICDRHHSCLCEALNFDTKQTNKNMNNYFQIKMSGKKETFFALKNTASVSKQTALLKSLFEGEYSCTCVYSFWRRHTSYDSFEK